MDKKKPSRGAGSKKKFTTRGAARGGRADNTRGAERRPAPERKAHITPNRQKGFAGGERPYDYSFYESEPATPEYMSRLFAKHSFPVNDRQLEQFWLYYDLLRRHNASLDLTRIMGIEATVLKHFVDSAVILEWFKPKGPVLDIGSGPGFPGVPLAVMQPDLRVILAESRGKRVGFLEEVVRELGLKNATIFGKSVREDSALGDDYGVPVGDVVTRALETMPPTLERVRPIVRGGGSVCFLKGPGSDEELDAARAAFAGVYELERDVAYTLPGSDQGRRLIIFRKNEELR